MIFTDPKFHHHSSGRVEDRLRLKLPAGAARQRAALEALEKVLDNRPSRAAAEQLPRAVWDFRRISVTNKKARTLTGMILDTGR